MTKFVPPGFNRAEVLAGLHRAMGFGEPNNASDKATFVSFDALSGNTRHDDNGVPFDPGARVSRVPKPVQVPCAVEWADASDVSGGFGSLQPTTIRVTLLDPDYRKVKGFEYVLIGGDKYNYRETEPPVALGSIDIWTVHVQAEDES